MVSAIKNIIQKDKRSALIGKNIAFSFLLKIWSAVVIFLLVPYTLNCLGEYKNGVWLTMSSLLLWIDQLDIGLGNGLRNKLASYIADNDIEKAREAVSSTFFMLFVVVIPVAVVLCLFINTADLYSLLNIDSNFVKNLSEVFTVATIFVCATFVLKFIGNFYLGLQLPAVNNLLVVSGQTLALLATVFLYYNGVSSLISIAVVNTFPPLIVYIVAYVYSFYFKYSKFRPTFGSIKKVMVKQLFGFGVQFFILQMAGCILFMTSNMLISRLFSPNVVTPYQITYRYFSIVLMVFTVICTPYWSATTDAYKRKDMAWIVRSNKLLNKILLAIGVMELFMVIASPLFYDIWIGKNVMVPLSMTVMMGVYMFITVSSLRFSFILNGIGVLRLQLYITVSAAICFIPLALIAVKITNSIVWFMTVLCAVNIPGLVINIIQYKKIVNNKAHGIWIK